MKRSHRRSHLLIWVFLAPVIFAGLYLSLQLRQPTPYTDDALIELTGSGGN